MTRHLFPHSLPKARGFTMLELLVAMSVTVILLGMVTFMTGVSMDGYKGSRDKVVAGRQAKEALDAITKDFEAMVVRMDGSDNMWLYADVEPKLVADGAANTTLVGPANKKIPNAPRLIFFTAAPDRYDGDFGGDADNGGDVSAVSYRLVYRDQISGAAANAVGAFPSFTLYRHLVDPDDTFTNVLGQANLTAPVAPAVNQFTDALDFTAENVLAENIYELTVTFLVQVPLYDDDVTPTKYMPYLLRASVKYDAATLNNEVNQFKIAGNGISWAGKIKLPEGETILPNGIEVNFDTPSSPLNGYSIDPDTIKKKGQLVGVEISMTVLSERGLVMTEKGGMTRQDIIKDYCIHYTHSINVSRF